MRILVVNEYFAPGGGTEQYLLPLCDELESRGHKVAILYGMKTGGEVGVEGRSAHFVPDILSFRCGNNRKGLRELLHCVEKEDPDLIYLHQVHNPYAIELLTDSKPTVRYVHGHKMVCPSGARMLRSSDVLCVDPPGLRCICRAYTQRCMPRNFLEAASLLRIGKGNRKANRRINKLVVASAFMKTMLGQNGQDESRIEVIPYYTAIPSMPREKSVNEEAAKEILFVGRLVPFKGIPSLLTALRLLKGDWHCTIVGEGTESATAERLSAEFGFADRVDLTGWLPNKEIAEYYDRSSVVVVPSEWPEPFGIVGIEAMSHGKPVVAFDVGGISEWLADGKSGFLVQRKDVRALAEKIEVLLNDAALAKRFGENGRAIVEERFSKEIHLGRLMKLFEDVIHHGRSRES